MLKHKRVRPLIKIVGIGAGIFGTSVINRWGQNAGQVTWDYGKNRFSPPPSVPPEVPFSVSTQVLETKLTPSK